MEHVDQRTDAGYPEFHRFDGVAGLLDGGGVELEGNLGVAGVLPVQPARQLCAELLRRVLEPVLAREVGARQCSDRDQVQASSAESPRHGPVYAGTARAGYASSGPGWNRACISFTPLMKLLRRRRGGAAISMPSMRVTRPRKVS